LQCRLAAEFRPPMDIARPQDHAKLPDSTGGCYVVASRVRDGSPTPRSGAAGVGQVGPMQRRSPSKARMSKKRRTTPGPYVLRIESRREAGAVNDKYPYTIPAVATLQELALHPKVTFFVGENGSGKSTLLEALAVRCRLNPEGGSRNFNFSTRASHSTLADDLLIIQGTGRGDAWFLRAESFFNVGTEIERLDRSILGAYGGKSLHEQSHGESFFALFRNRFGPHGLYLLDEPEAALSPQRQMSFLRLMHDHCRAGAQFIIATHSPIIMAYPDAWIYSFGEAGIARTQYTDTEHYRVTRSFLGNPQRSLDILMADD